MKKADVSFTFSGGSFNFNSNESLGGEPSVKPIGGRLFSDVTKQQAAKGRTDYRCFYLNNDHQTQTFYSTEVGVTYSKPGDVNIELGFIFENERQDLIVSNADTISSGYFNVTYTDTFDSYEVLVEWNSTLNTWASNFQTALQTVPFLEDVTVTAAESGDSVIFEISFEGSASNRYHEILSIDNNLLPSVEVAISKTTNGSPINSVADEIDVETTIPNNIDFVAETTSIGDLRPLDILPVWVKRRIPVNSGIIADDGFSFRIQGTAGA